MGVAKTVVIDTVALTPALLRHAPRIAAMAAATTTIEHVTPAVTCPVQTTYLTGLPPSGHGIVGNGWYSREDAEIRFWKQADGLVQAPRLWQAARQQNPRFTCANLFWWFNMYSAADFAVTPRPMYPADGRKLPDVWTHPADLRTCLQGELGQFPLFKFWGPMAGIESSRWIAESALLVDRKYDPTLTLIYLPHLDYNLQRLGPDDPAIAGDVAALDQLVGGLIDHYRAQGARVLVVNEYAIQAVRRAVHVNRVLRQAGLVAVRNELGREQLDAGASRVFAVADHQVAHIYANDPDALPLARATLERAEGIAQVLEGPSRQEAGLDHLRAGDLVALAAPDAHFTYYHWLDERKAPDFARTVDIHRKPGYDACELFLDPRLPMVKLRVAWRLLQKKLGFRALLDVIPLDADLVRGSHGVPSPDPEHRPLLACSDAALLASVSPGAGPLPATALAGLILQSLAT